MGIKHLVAGAAVALCVFGAGRANANAVSVTYYSDFTDTGSSITFASPFMTDSISGVNQLRDISGSDTDPAWPDAGIVFAADFTGELDVATAGTYSIAFGTDDAGYLFINGTLVANQGGVHGIGVADYSVDLAAGDNAFEIQYDNVECCGAVVEMDLPSGVSYAGETPEPASLAIFGAALAGFGFWRRRKNG